MTDAAELHARAELLLKQVRRHQIFREPMPEALKQSLAGAAYLEIAEMSVDDARFEALVNAAACFSRAKRLCRDMARDAAR